MIRGKLIKILQSSKDEFCVDLYEFINGNSNVKEAIDSLTFIRFVVLVEENIRVEFEDEKLSISCFKSADDLLDYITYLEERK